MRSEFENLNTYTAKPVCCNGWISDSYCSLKPLCSGMGEVVLVPRRPYFPHPLALSCHYPVSKCSSASIVVTGTVRVKSECMPLCLIRKQCLICHLHPLDIAVVMPVPFRGEGHVVRKCPSVSTHTISDQ